MNIRAGLANFISGGAFSQACEAAAHNANEAHYAGLGEHVARERLHELEAGLHSDLRGDGWQVLADGAGDKEFSREALKKINRLARLMWLKNPLIRRGVNVQASYVFGQGVTVSTEDDLFNECLQGFWDDMRNKRVFTERAALQQRDREQSLFGETFLALFTDRVYGGVQMRVFDCDSIEDVITNPDDRDEVWFYERHWTEITRDPVTGTKTQTPRISYYPDWLYNPAKKPSTFAGNPIEWDTPIYHIKTGNLSDMLRGVSEVYCQIDWAKAYTRFLENRATVAEALSRFALKASAKTKKGVAAVKTKLASTVGLAAKETNPAPAAGSTAVLGEGRDLDVMSVKGATINPEEGRRFLLMVACGAGLPETFYGDVSVGTLATATSLDRPTEMAMEDRRGLWSTVLSNLALYVLLQSSRAPRGLLKGKATIKYAGITPQLWVGENKVEIKIEFPPLLQPNTKERVESIDKAAKYLNRKPRLIARLMLLALGEKNIDELVKDIPENAEPEAEPSNNPESTPTDPKTPTEKSPKTTPKTDKGAANDA